MHDSRSLTAGLSAVDVDTSRLRTHALTGGSGTAPVLALVHGNVSSSTFFEDLMVRLAPHLRLVAPDLRGYGASETKPVDATRGLRDFADDLEALLATETVGAADRPVHLLGWSMGCGVVMQYAIDHPDRVASLVLESPMSPYGFSGTKDIAGTPCWEDYAGSGGGTVSPEVVRGLTAGNRNDDSPVAPRRILKTLYVKPGTRLDPEWEEALLSSMLATATGDANYPGDSQPSPNWPLVAPGTRGVVNALSPKYCNLTRFADIVPRPDILWVRGADDKIVSDTSLSDIGYLGQSGVVPGWPGNDVFPAHPMVSQLRALLDRYRAHGGHVEERVMPDCGHSPHLEHPQDFATLVRDFLEARG